MRYSVKFTGVLLNSFAPSRVLRQGDLLLAFLFILVACGLSILFGKVVRANEVMSLTVNPGAPSISHSLFVVDDTLLFFKVSRGQAQQVGETIDTYVRETCQLINHNHPFC